VIYFLKIKHIHQYATVFEEHAVSSTLLTAAAVAAAAAACYIRHQQ